jgi:RND superfamily putative drug exporter
VAELLYRLGKLAARRAGTVVIAWAVLLVLAGGAYLFGAGTLSSNFDIPGTPTDKVATELAHKLPAYSGASGFAVFTTTNDKPFTAAQKTSIGELATGSESLPHVTTASDPFVTEANLTKQSAEISGALAQLPAGAPQRAQLEVGAKLLGLAKGIRTVSPDGTTAILNIDFDKSQEQLPQAAKTKVITYFQDHPVSGTALSLSSVIAQTVPEVIGVGEVTGFVLAGIVLLIMLGTFVAAGLPLLSALVGVGVGVLFCLSLSGVVDEASVSPVLGVMLGLAVGIDYSLFIINRHRKQLRQGMDLHESIGLATGTAGNAVVFAGWTVVVALLALNITGIQFIGVMGTVGAVCIVVAVLIAVSFTPAMLHFVGFRVLTRSGRETIGHDKHIIGTVRPMSTLRAIITVVLAIGVLLTIAIPALSLRLGLPDASSDPVASTTYKSFTIAAKKFGPGINAELVVTAALPKGLSATQITDRQLTIAQAIDKHATANGHSDIAAIAPIGVATDKSLTAFAVLPKSGPNDASTGTLVREIRAMKAEGTDTHLDE